MNGVCKVWKKKLEKPLQSLYEVGGYQMGLYFIQKSLSQNHGSPLISVPDCVTVSKRWQQQRGSLGSAVLLYIDY